MRKTSSEACFITSPAFLPSPDLCSSTLDIKISFLCIGLCSSVKSWSSVCDKPDNKNIFIYTARGSAKNHDYKVFGAVQAYQHTLRRFAWKQEEETPLESLCCQRWEVYLYCYPSSGEWGRRQSRSYECKGTRLGS